MTDARRRPDMSTPRSNYRIISDDPDLIVIQDIGPWDTYMSVTNDAERVIQRIAPASNQRVYYYDSEGNCDELVHENGRFVGFRYVDTNERPRIGKWK